MIRVAKTENGMVRGLPSSDARITVYKGIPFAKPPVGENRWRAPQPCDNWEGIRDAYEYGPIAIQDTPGLGTDVYCKEWHVDPDIPMSEDCLYLNVWTPAKSPDEKYPVFVWIYGGAFQWGYTSEMEFEGDRIARRGVVVVSMGYRLGALGFMAHPELTKESPKAPTNFGSLDQQAALKWVKRNIAAFGGDPDAITLGGQSAGGASVMTQVTCEDNFGDLKGAAILSGIIRPQYRVDEFFKPGPLERAEKLGSEFIDFLGVSGIEEARKLDAIYIRDKYAEFAMDHMRMGICIDGQFCKGEPMSLLANNKSADIPLFMGNTTDEFVGAINADDETGLRQQAESIFEDKADEFLSYTENRTKYADGYARISALEPNIKAVMELRNQSGSDKANYYYEFDVDIPGEDNPGTFHSVDLWFFFETLAKSFRPFVGRHYDVSRQMCNYLTQFIKNGNPNGYDADGTKMPEWNAYTAEKEDGIVFTSNGACQKAGNDERMRFFIDWAKSHLKMDRKEKV